MSLTKTKEVPWYNQIIAFLIPLSFYFCFTNYVYLSAIGVLTIAVLPFFVTKEKNFCLQNTARKILISLVTFFVLCIFSTLITHPESLISFDFYRRDGNVFISYLSLVVLICTAIDFDVWAIIKRFIYISTIANVIALGLHFLKITSSYPEYWMFFTAHNAAGGFLGMLCLINFGLICKHKGKGLPTICILINLFSLYLTNSRGSIFPLIGAFLFLLFYRKTIFKNLDLVFNVGLFLIFFFFTMYVVGVLGDELIADVGIVSEIPKVFKGGLVDKFLSSINRSHTVADRLYGLYPRALYLFTLSPIIGVGMGAFNDNPYNIVGPQNFVSLNISEAVYDSGHAHNSFFHILAENGLIGFIAIVLFIWYIREYSKKIKDRNLANIIFLGINFAVLTSFFEHRLFTPAEMLPFIYLLGMIISKENYKKQEKIYVEEYCVC